MLTLKGIIKHMVKSIEDLLAEVSTIHSDHDIDQEVTDKVAAAINTAVPVAITAATEGLQKQVTDQQTVIQAIVDQLTAGNSDAALATAQNAVPASPIPAPAPDTVGSAA